MNAARSAAAAFFVLLCVAAAPSARTHYYVVEYQKTVRGGVPVLDVTFYVAVDAKKAEAVLRRELLAAVEFEKPTQDVLASAWDGRDKAPGDEDKIELPNGAGALVYLAKSGQVKTDLEAFDKK